MMRRGVFVRGRFRRCAEVDRGGVPECIGRAARPPDGCTCNRWNAEQREVASDLGITARTSVEYRDALRALGWSSADALALVPYRSDD